MDDCVAFLKWALPRMGLRWQGYRRVRRRVCKRIARRVRALGLRDVAAYRAYLDAHADEWPVLDGLCRITISRFFRDPGVFAHLAGCILPCLAEAAAGRGASCVRCWCAGCASGEEPYSLILAWTFEAASRSPELSIVATDADERLLERARDARYPAGCLKDVPAHWRDRAFGRSGKLHCLRPEFRACVVFERQDVRRTAPEGRFDLVLCRNLAFTYFTEEVQRDVLRRLVTVLAPGGALVIGARERLPGEVAELASWAPELGIYRRR